MKMGKSKAMKPTRAQKIWIEKAGLEPRDWLVRIDAPHSLALVHRSSGASRVIEKG
jgi:hypothetical protein